MPGTIRFRHWLAGHAISSPRYRPGAYSRVIFSRCECRLCSLPRPCHAGKEHAISRRRAIAAQARWAPAPPRRIMPADV